MNYKILFAHIRHAVFSGHRGTPHKGRTRIFSTSLFFHIRPRSVPERTLRFTLTWGLGGAAVVLVFLLIGTGMLLKFVYEPFPAAAYESITRLQHNVPFGRLMRNVHHWSGNLLLLVSFLHLLRVFFTGAFDSPRRFNWIIGLGMLFLIMIANFTGYLLPWDQLAYWAITIFTGMLEYLPGAGRWLQELIRGGAEVGPDTLMNFYALHTAVIPAALVTLMMLHFWRVRKAPGLVVPRTPEENTNDIRKKVPTIPNLILREVVVALVVIAGVLIFSIVVDAPLLGKANPGLSPNPTKAPWYFAGVQELLMHFHPLFSLCVIPAVTVAGLVLFPYISYGGDTAGVWFASCRGRRMAVIAAVAAAVATPALIVADEYLFDAASWLSGLPPVIGNGLIPFVIILTATAGFSVLLKRRYSASAMERVQSVFVLLLVAFVIMTVAAIYFRGPGMKLMWP